MSLAIERTPLRGTELAEAYLSDFERVAGFYCTGSPRSLDSYRTVSEAVRSRSEPSRWKRIEELADTFSETGRKRLGRLIEERGLFVATGQQAGLFVGPLFVLYKALTAARLAERLQRELDLPVMPLFSVASEDHDWAEVDHTHIIDLENRLVRLEVSAQEDLSAQEAPSPPVERIRLSADVDAALTALEEATPDTEFKTKVLAPLKAAYRPGRTAAEAFQQALRHLLDRYPFAVVRTASPYVKRGSRDLLLSEWRRREDSEGRMMERAAALEDAGFEPQVPVTAKTTNLFMDGRLGRDRVLDQDGRARLRRSGESFDDEELRRIVGDEPTRLSPGALLRPVAEAAAFPVIAHVAGPGEIAYLAQSHALFELHEVPAPVVVPRASFRLVESKVARVLEKYDIEAERLAGDSATIRRILDEQTPEALREALRALRRAAAGAIEEVETIAVEFDPGARSAVGSGKSAIFGAIGELESKLQARVREKHAVMEQQLEKVAVNLFPDGRPQERVLNPYPYLVRYGESLLEQLYAAADPPVE